MENKMSQTIFSFAQQSAAQIVTATDYPSTDPSAGEVLTAVVDAAPAVSAEVGASVATAFFESPATSVLAVVEDADKKRGGGGRPKGAKDKAKRKNGGGRPKGAKDKKPRVRRSDGAASSSTGLVSPSDAAVAEDGASSIDHAVESSVAIETEAAMAVADGHPVAMAVAVAAEVELKPEEALAVAEI